MDNWSYNFYPTLNLLRAWPALHGSVMSPLGSVSTVHASPVYALLSERVRSGESSLLILAWRFKQPASPLVFAVFCRFVTALNDCSKRQAARLVRARNLCRPNLVPMKGPGNEVASLRVARPAGRQRKKE